MSPMILRHSDIRIQAERAWLDALLSFAPDVRGLIISAAPYIGNLRDSRDSFAAAILQEAGYGTLIVSMLTPYEENRDPDVRYDVTLLGHRLQALLTWIDQQPGLSGLPLGLQCSGTVVASAVRYLAHNPERVSALVSRSGRADLAGAEPLRRLRAPFLMQVPGAARDITQPSLQAYALIEAEKEWQEIPHASLSFIEPGTLDTVSRRATEWFLQYLPARLPPEAPELKLAVPAERTPDDAAPT